MTQPRDPDPADETMLDPQTHLAADPEVPPVEETVHDGLEPPGDDRPEDARDSVPDQPGVDPDWSQQGSVTDQG